MTRSGTRTRVITLSCDGEKIGTNAMNEPVYGPPITFARLAGRSDVSDSERFAAGQVGAFRSTRFIVLSDPDTRKITPAYRLTHEELEYNIVGVKETLDGRHQAIEITATCEADL